MATVQVTVAAPEAPPLTISVRPGSPDPVFDLGTMFPDPAASLQYSVTTNDNPGLVATAIDPGSSSLTLTRQPGQFGSAAIVVRATDAGGGGYAERTIQFSAPTQNSPPSIGSLLVGPDPAVQAQRFTCGSERDG